MALLRPATPLRISEKHPNRKWEISSIAVFHPLTHITKSLNIMNIAAWSSKLTPFQGRFHILWIFPFYWRGNSQNECSLLCPFNVIHICPDSVCHVEGVYSHWKSMGIHVYLILRTQQKSWTGGGRGSGGPASHTHTIPDLVPPPGSTSGKFGCFLSYAISASSIWEQFK